MEKADRIRLRRNLPLLTHSMDFDMISMNLMSKLVFDKHHIEKFQSNPTSMLRNRDLLLSLEIRGPTAFQSFIEALVDDDDQGHVYLAEKLGYQAPDDGDLQDYNLSSTSSPPRSSQEEEDASFKSSFSRLSSLEPTSVIDLFHKDVESDEWGSDSTDAFPSHMLNSRSAYSMTAKPRGIALIINNRQFKTLPPRPAAIMDFTILWETFQALGFNIIVYENFSSKDIKRILQKHAHQSHAHFDCLSVVILSHGEEGSVYGSDETLVTIEDIVSSFNDDRCDTLRGKPKIFFIHAPLPKQSMEGERVEDAAVIRRPLVEHGGEGSGTSEPFNRDSLSACLSRTRDALLFYSHLPEHVTGKQMSGKGTLFVKSLTEMLRQEAMYEDLNSIIYLAHDEMETSLGEDSTDHSRLIPSPLSSLRKKVYFLPGYFDSHPERPLETMQDKEDKTPVPASTGGTNKGYNLSYRMQAKPRGVAVIINNKKFTNMNTRNGTDVDCETLTDLFGWLEFEVHVKHNLTGKDTRKLIDKYSQKVDHSPYDCFIMAILTHGSNGAIYCSDGEMMKIEDVTDSFGSDRCPSLAQKPKIFFLQACRGDGKDPGCDMADSVIVSKGLGEAPKSVQITSEEEQEKLVERLLDLDLMDETDSARINKLPTMSDMLLAYATVPGYVSWRNSMRGSWFVQAVNKVFRDCAKEQDLLHMTTWINREVATIYESSTGRFKMMPAPVNMLTKKLYFFPDN